MIRIFVHVLSSLRYHVVVQRFPVFQLEDADDELVAVVRGLGDTPGPSMAREIPAVG